MTRANTPADVWARIDTTGGTASCWEWSGAMNAGGYGQVKLSGRSPLVHRLVWEWTVGPIPRGMTLDHLCFNVRCCNPNHLEIKSRSANSKRKKVTVTNICKRGHDLTVTGRDIGNGRRQCSECLRITSAAHYEKLKRGEYTPPAMASCKRGHIADSFKQHPDGRWFCAECKRITNKKPPKPRRTACREGHDYATDGRREANGSWRCVTCHNARRRERYAAKS